MFNWYIFKNFPCVRKFVSIENNTYCMFLLTVNFFKVCATGNDPGCIGIVYVSLYI